jgi:dTDP-4-amino-4,6-dideoxygalactose transaminase
MGCLSFHETKNIISGEGGALLVNDERLFDRAEVVLEKGTDRRRFFRLPLYYEMRVEDTERVAEAVSRYYV